MSNKEIIKGLDLVIDGLITIKASLIEEKVEAPKKEVETPKTEEPKAVEKEAPTEVTGNYTVEQLQAMKYNEFKKLAATLGVKCTGTRDEIMKRILELGNVTEEATITDEPEVVEEAPVEEPVEEPTKSDKPTGGKKLSKTKTAEPTKDEFDEQAEEIAKDTSIEDIIEALEDVDIKATKKNAVEKLAEALREGLIELDDEEDEEEVEEVEAEVEETEAEVDEEETEETEDEEEISATSYFPQYDPKGYNDPKNMSEERAEAIENKMDEILTAYSEGDLKDDEIASYVEDNATEDEVELLGEDYSEEDILCLYMELIKRTIDNDGEEHEQGEPYEVADKDVCCGHELKYSKKTKQYICEHCGTEYEAE